MSKKQILHKERTRIRETGAFFTEKGQRPARPYNGWSFIKFVQIFGFAHL